MFTSATFDASHTSRKHFNLPNGTGFWKSDFIRGEHGVNPAPHSFLVEQDANEVILPHFHEQNQFQVIVAGGGSLGRNEVSPIVVHYAGAYTGYGPITAGPMGLHYFTFRPMLDNGALFVHESRDKMKRGPKKHFQSAPAQTLSTAALAALTESTTITLAEDADGLVAKHLHLAPGQSTASVDPRTGGGQYLLVMNGAAIISGQTLNRLGCAFVSNDEAALNVMASDAGAEVLVLQFPRAEYVATFIPGTSPYHGND
ncbi:MAG: hypothetical protein ABIU95_14240 [Burkholderiales bacterium]